MKRCVKCGYLSKEESSRCENCAAALGEERASLDAAADKTIYGEDFLEAFEEYFRISLYNKIAAGLCAGLAAATVASLIIRFDPLSLYMLFINFLLAAAGIIDSLFPRVSWAMMKWRLSFQIRDPDRAVPSDWQFNVRKITPVLSIVFGVVFLLFVLVLVPAE